MARVMRGLNDMAGFVIRAFVPKTNDESGLLKLKKIMNESLSLFRHTGKE